MNNKKRCHPKTATKRWASHPIIKPKEQLHMSPNFNNCTQSIPNKSPLSLLNHPFSSQSHPYKQIFINQSPATVKM